MFSAGFVPTRFWWREIRRNKYQDGGKGDYLIVKKSSVNVLSEEYMEIRFCLKRKGQITKNKGAIILA
jgi:hypothetical protein